MVKAVKNAMLIVGILIIIVVVVVPLIVMSLIYDDNDTGDVVAKQDQAIEQLENEVDDLQEKIKEEILTKTRTTEPKKEEVSDTKTADVSYGSGRFLNMEVPKTWSIVKIPESVGQNALPDSPTLAIAKNNVSFGDANANQIDFYFVQEDVADTVLDTIHEDETVEKTEETIARTKATVYQLPTDTSGNTKLGGGGKYYVITLDDEFAKTLVIHKQTKGDAEFEQEFEAIIKSIQL